MTFCQSRMQKNTWHSQLTAFYQAGTECGLYAAIRHHIVHSPIQMLLSKPKLAWKGNHAATFSVADKTHHWSAGQDEVSLASPQLSLQRFSADKAASAAHLYHSRATVKLSAKHEDRETLGSDKGNPIFQKIKPNNPMSGSFDLLFSLKTFLNSITQ